MAVAVRPEPTGPVVDVWQFDAASVHSSGAGVLTVEERDRAAAFVHDHDRLAYQHGHELLRRVLGQRVGQPPESLRFDQTCVHCGDATHGKPRLDPADADEALDFSLSHSGSIVLLAVGPGPLGADVEVQNGRAPSDGVVRRCCSRPEAAWLDAMDGATRPASFLTLWTRKEAASKAVGLGLAAPFSTIDVLGPDPHPVRLAGLDLAVYSLPSDAGAVAALACPPGTDVRTRFGEARPGS